ncbi:MAG: hypothetical protein ACYDB7_07315 [Mycobacteriales bacterium]
MRGSAVPSSPALAASGAAWANDGAAFRYGTDSNQPTVTSSGPPCTNAFHDYVTGTNTSLGGIYGGYLGRLTSWFTVNGCGGDQQNNTTNVSDANANFSAGYGQGAAELLKFGGPGVDPNYDPSAPSGAGAHPWGAKQGDAAIVAWQQSPSTSTIFGCGSCSSGPGYLSGVYEWTYGNQVSRDPSSTIEPQGWCVSATGTCAQFFAGQSTASATAVLWQWAASNTNVGDFDQISTSRLGVG